MEWREAEEKEIRERMSVCLDRAEQERTRLGQRVNGPELEREGER